MASRVFTFLVIFHVQVAQGERDGALYCVVLFALRCFVTGWGLFLSGRLACLATCLCFHFRSWCLGLSGIAARMPEVGGDWT